MIFSSFSILLQQRIVARSKIINPRSDREIRGDNEDGCPYSSLALPVLSGDSIYNELLTMDFIGLYWTAGLHKDETKRCHDHKVVNYLRVAVQIGRLFNFKSIQYNSALYGVNPLRVILFASGSLAIPS